jgi:hypothetical protein
MSRARVNAFDGLPVIRVAINGGASLGARSHRIDCCWMMRWSFTAPVTPMRAPTGVKTCKSRQEVGCRPRMTAAARSAAVRDK